MSARATLLSFHSFISSVRFSFLPVFSSCLFHPPGPSVISVSSWESHECWSICTHVCLMSVCVIVVQPALTNVLPFFLNTTQLFILSTSGLPTTNIELTLVLFPDLQSNNPVRIMPWFYRSSSSSAKPPIPVVFAHLNAQSVSNKSFIFNDLITHPALNFLCFTETCLITGGALPSQASFFLKALQVDWLWWSIAAVFRNHLSCCVITHTKINVGFLSNCLVQCLHFLWPSYLLAFLLAILPCAEAGGPKPNK